ncbi:MAG TPA: hypothetical protein PKK12_07910 [Candidatus Aminicenantes bacterium]|nr:hypothetical protein [Candidatus Aminicenantes bacterium]
MKKAFVLPALLMVTFLCLPANPIPQTVSQLGFVVKTAIPAVETIAIVFNQSNQAQVEGEAKAATLVTKKKILIYGVTTKADIAKHISSISGLGGNVVAVVYSDNAVLNADSVKFITQKLGVKKIPVVSTRAADTLEGALLGIVKTPDKLEKHLNKKVMPIFGITLAPEFLADCIVDIE